MPDTLDGEDRAKLFASILRQAIEDYIKLQPPNKRRKKHLREAFDTAVTMLMDSEYRMENITNSDGDHMSLQDFLADLLENEDPDLMRLKSYVIEEAVAYWETKDLRALEIPTSLVVDGHIYMVAHQDRESYQVDHENQVIFVNTDDSSTRNQEQFVHAVSEIIAYNEDIKMSRLNRERIGASWFRILRMNNCFCGD